MASTISLESLAVAEDTKKGTGLVCVFHPSWGHWLKQRVEWGSSSISTAYKVRGGGLDADKGVTWWKRGGKWICLWHSVWIFEVLCYHNILWYVIHYQMRDWLSGAIWVIGLSWFLLLYVIWSFQLTYYFLPFAFFLPCCPSLCPQPSLDF